MYDGPGLCLLFEAGTFNRLFLQPYVIPASIVRSASAAFLPVLGVCCLLAVDLFLIALLIGFSRVCQCLVPVSAIAVQLESCPVESCYVPAGFQGAAFSNILRASSQRFFLLQLSVAGSACSYLTDLSNSSCANTYRL